MDDPYVINNNSFLINGGSLYTNSSSATLDLIADEDVVEMCISVNDSNCTNYIDFVDIYTLDWSSESDGEKVIYVYYKNASGKVVASMNKSIILDRVGPTDNSVIIEDGAGLTRTLTIASTGASQMCFSNTSSEVSSCVDWMNYSTSTKWRLSDGIGAKTVYAFFKDVAGNISSTIATTEVTSIVEFTVNEDFSDTIYDSNITVIDGDTYPWSVSNGQFISTNNGVNSSTSSSTIQFIPTVNATLSFDYGVSSESNYDKLTITLVGDDSSSITLVSAISGTNSGSITDINLTAGVTYTLSLSYVKDGSSASGSDIGYIDNLMIQS